MQTKKIKKNVKPKSRRVRTRPADSVREFLLARVTAHPSDIVAVAKKRFGISSVAIQKNLRRLVAEGRMIKQGKTRNTRWILAPKVSMNYGFTISPQLQEHVIWESTVKPNAELGVKANVLDIIRYGFTEILNNAIDHANATTARLSMSSRGKVFSMTVSDDGVGIFRKIQEAFGLADPRESILELTKGKVTTDRQRHSGEGLFFTSRAFDHFEIESHGLVFIKDNLNSDWLIDSREDSAVSGTAVTMKIRKDSEIRLPDIFDRYSDPETREFDRTQIVVALAKLHETDYVSRSQAKRILAGLEKFRRVVLDFRNVRTVGQAFVDEVFRVFATEHPEIKFESINANENVEFMIKRGIVTGARG